MLDMALISPSLHFSLMMIKHYHHHQPLVKSLSIPSQTHQLSTFTLKLKVYIPLIVDITDGNLRIFRRRMVFTIYVFFVVKTRIIYD